MCALLLFCFIFNDFCLSDKSIILLIFNKTVFLHYPNYSVNILIKKHIFRRLNPKSIKNGGFLNLFYKIRIENKADFVVFPVS